jgi:hypothetical protein
VVRKILSELNALAISNRFSGELLRQECTGGQAIKDLTAAALEKEKKKK